MSTQLESTRRASFKLPSPMRMLTKGAPPTPMREATEPIMVTTGPQTPAPAKARSPTSGMKPM